jgi:hypothetical protein
VNVWQASATMILGWGLLLAGWWALLRRDRAALAIVLFLCAGAASCALEIDDAAAHAGKHPVANWHRWERVSDCESGDRDRNGRPMPGTARWRYNGLHDGGPQFNPGTWAKVNRRAKPRNRYAFAYQAPKWVQIAGAERWRHMIGGNPHQTAGWPGCGRYW